MKNNFKLLKHGYRLSIFSLFASLLTALFLIFPIFWVSSFVFTITKNINNETTAPLLLSLGLFIFTIIKIGLSIAGLVFGFKIRKRTKLSKEISPSSKLVVSLLIMNILISATSIVALVLGLIIEIFLYVEILVFCLHLTSFILLLIYHIKTIKKEKNSININ